MDAIKKKMQAMKLEKDNAMDMADTCEQKAREAKQRAIKAQEEVQDLEKKSQQLESELDKAKEDLLTTTEKLKEKESTLAVAELGEKIAEDVVHHISMLDYVSLAEVNSLNRRVINLEGDLETCEDRLLLASQKLDKAATAADDSDRMRKVLTSRAAQDEERMSKLEEELKGRKKDKKTKYSTFRKES